MSITIARIMTADLAAIKAIYPWMICPHCGTLYLGMPHNFGPEYECSCCGYLIGVDLQTGAVWPAEEAQFLEWEKPECGVIEWAS